MILRSFTLLIKPTGPDCNLACKYCFYTGKTSLFGSGSHRMTEEVLDKLICDYMKLNLPVSDFAWQGGEPTLMGLDFFKKVVSLQKKYGRNGQTVGNSLQTNGLLLDEQWCEFLSEYNFLVGISLDGPKKFHDHYRLGGNGKGSYDSVTASIERCRKHNIPFNILVLLNNVNVNQPDEIFDFFIENQIQYLQFIPCVEKDPQNKTVTDFSITPEQYGDFLCRAFDRWMDFGPEKLSIRTFESVLSKCLAGEHSVCTFRNKCNDYVVVEHNGDVFSCDFFVEDRWHLGNIFETPIQKLADCEKKHQFSALKSALSNQCLTCRHLSLCRGGCLKDRIVLNDDYSAASYFCDSYKQFYDYAMPRFWQFAAR